MELFDVITIQTFEVKLSCLQDVQRPYVSAASLNIIAMRRALNGNCYAKRKGISVDMVNEHSIEFALGTAAVE